MKLTTRLYTSFLIAAMLIMGIGGLTPAPAAVFERDKDTNIVSAFLPDTQTGPLATLGYNSLRNPNIVVLGYSESVRVFEKTTATIAATFAVTTPAAVTFTCVAATDVCTASAATLFTGLKGQGTTTTTLPAGLSLTTDYFPIMVTGSTTTFKVASSYANAIAGTAIDITSTGTGTHTFTPTALAGGTAILQGSLDGTNWYDVGSSQNVTAATTLVFSITSTTNPLARLKYVNTAGVLTASTRYAMK